MRWYHPSTLPSAPSTDRSTAAHPTSASSAPGAPCGGAPLSRRAHTCSTSTGPRAPPGRPRDGGSGGSTQLNCHCADAGPPNGPTVAGTGGVQPADGAAAAPLALGHS